MKNLCFLLGEELLRWPQVTARPMFGMRAFYRAGVVFAMLPDKRALRDAHAIAYKLPDGSEKREGLKWKFLSFTNGEQISVALETLDKAYRKAALPATKSRKGRESSAGG